MIQSSIWIPKVFWPIICSVGPSRGQRAPWTWRWWTHRAFEEDTCCCSWASFGFEMYRLHRWDGRWQGYPWSHRCCLLMISLFLCVSTCFVDDPCVFVLGKLWKTTPTIALPMIAFPEHELLSSGWSCWRWSRVSLLFYNKCSCGIGRRSLKAGVYEGKCWIRRSSSKAGVCEGEKKMLSRTKILESWSLWGKEKKRWKGLWLMRGSVIDECCYCYPHSYEKITIFSRFPFWTWWFP